MMAVEEGRDMPKVLVVEDEVHIQRLIKLVLERNGVTVDTVGNGEEALKYLETSPAPDLILLDILMPGIDGLQVLKTIKAHSSYAAIPVVMLTALAQENVVLQGIKLGAKDYIRKPFHPNELVKRLAKHLTA
jgi:CheY-like chemotaxis protein